MNEGGRRADGLVSAVIPTFNHGRFLPDAIQSALGQDYLDLEVIVVDDGSTDDTRSIVDNYGGRVRYIWQENAGLSGARNTGIRASRGQRVAFLDADDSWVPTFLSTVMSRWQDDPDLGAVYTGFQSIDKDGQQLPQTGTETVPDDRLYDRLVDGEFFVPSTVVTKRECFDRVGFFDEALRASEDWDMWMRVARAYRFAGIAEPLVNYRIHGSNMSGNPDHMLHYQWLVAEKHFGQPESSPEGWPRDRRRGYGAVYRYAVQGYYLTGDVESARRYLRLALETNPALCSSVDMYYELGCADQPLGHRSIHARINVEKNAAFVISNLEDIFEQQNLPSRLRSCKRSALGHAYLAMALLAYGNERIGLARHYMTQALVNQPGLLSDRRAVSTMAKTMLGRRLLGVLKGLRRHERTGQQG